MKAGWPPRRFSRIRLTAARRAWLRPQGLSGQVGAKGIRVLLRQEAGQGSQTPGSGEDGGVPQPVPVPLRDRGDDVGAGSENRGQAIARAGDGGGAVLRHDEGSGTEHLPGGGLPGAEREEKSGSGGDPPPSARRHGDSLLPSGHPDTKSGGSSRVHRLAARASASTGGLSYYEAINFLWHEFSTDKLYGSDQMQADHGD